MAFLGQSQQSARSGIRLWDALLSNETLPDEACYIRPHTVLVTVILELFKILARDGTELANFSEALNFRSSDGIRSAAKFVRLARLDRALRFRFWSAFGCQSSIILRVTVRSLFQRGVRRTRLAGTGNRLGSGVSGIDGFRRVIARHASPPPLRGMERSLPSARHVAACRDARVFCRCP